MNLNEYFFSKKSLHKLWLFFGATPKPTYNKPENIDCHKILFHVNKLISIKNRDGRYRFVNKTFCEITGLPNKKIIGKNDQELGLFLNPDKTVVADQKVLSLGQKVHIPLEPFTDIKGNLFWLETKKIPLTNEANDESRLLTISTNVTKKLHFERTLRQSEQRYKSLFDNNYSGIIVMDKNLGIINSNKAFLSLVQQSIDSNGQINLGEYTATKDGDELKDLMTGLAARNYDYFDIELALNVSGQVVYTNCFVCGLYSQEGIFTEAVVTFQDTTKDVKNRLALQQSENRFRIIVENATEALILFDFDSGLYIDANKNAVSLFGYTRDELLQLRLGEMSPLNQTTGENSMELVAEYMKKALAGEKVVYDWIIRRKDNKFVPCEIRLVKLPFEGNNIVRISIVDITERKRSEGIINLEKQKLQKSNEDLQLLNNRLQLQTKQLKEFAYISSHNLRSPAGNIRALLDFYKNEPTPDNLKLCLDKLDVVSADLLETINELAAVVKIKNELHDKIESVNLMKVIDKVVGSLSEQVKDRHAEFDINLNGISDILSAKTYIESILLNLISNSLKYARTDVRTKIKITAKSTDTYFVLSVADNGLGLDLEKYKDKVFGLRKTFHRNKDSRGVGLFITKAQVEALDGEISVQSKPNKGSVFTIKLPKRVII